MSVTRARTGRQTGEGSQRFTNDRTPTDFEPNRTPEHVGNAEENAMNKTIATIPKNQREEIRVALSEFEKDGKTFDMAGARVFYDDGAGERKPGRNGINIPVRLLPELVAALSEAEAEARATGLLPAEADDDRSPSESTAAPTGE